MIEKGLPFISVETAQNFHDRPLSFEKNARFLRTGVIVAGAVLAISLLRTGELLVAGPNWDPSQGKSLATLNQMLSGILVLACIVSGLVCVRELFRVVRHLNCHSNG